MGSHILTSVTTSDVYLQTLTPDGDLVGVIQFGTGIPSALYVDTQGVVYTAGTYFETADFDPGPSVNLLSPENEYNLFIHKMDASGTMIWVRGFGGTEFAWMRGLDVDDLGNVYSTGVFNGIIDINPGQFNTFLYSQGNSDIFIQKLSAYGSFAFGKRIGAYGTDDASGLVIDSENKLLLAGEFEYEVDLDPGGLEHLVISRGNSDIFLEQLTTSGAFQWGETFGSALGEMLTFALETDAANHILMSGYFYGDVDVEQGPGHTYLHSMGGGDAFVQKLDVEGNPIWAVRFGSVGLDVAADLHTDEAGNIYACGQFEGVVDFDPGQGVFEQGILGKKGIFILKLSADAELIWVKTITGEGNIHFNSMALDATGNICLTGSFDGAVDFDPGQGVVTKVSNGSSDIVVLKLDPQGNFQWVQTMGGSDTDYGEEIEFDENGDVLVGGYFGNLVDFDPGPGTLFLDAGTYLHDLFLEKFDASGNALWVNQFGDLYSSEALEDLFVTPENDVYFIGAFENSMDADPGPDVHVLSSNGNRDAFSINIDPAGNFVSALQIGGDGTDFFESMSTDSEGNMYLSGLFEGLVDFDPSDSGTFLLYNDYYASPFILKLDASGLFQWAGGFQSNYHSSFTKVHADKEDNLLLSGYFFGDIDCDPGDEEYVLDTRWYTTFILKLTQGSSGVPSLIPGTQLHAWPNPTTGPLTIDLGDQPLNVEVTVTGVECKLLKRLYFENAQILDVPLDGLMPGVYFVQVRGEGVLATVRAVKE